MFRQVHNEQLLDFVFDLSNQYRIEDITLAMSPFAEAGVRFLVKEVLDGVLLPMEFRLPFALATVANSVTLN